MPSLWLVLSLFKDVSLDATVVDCGPAVTDTAITAGITTINPLHLTIGFGGDNTPAPALLEPTTVDGVIAQVVTTVAINVQVVLHQHVQNVHLVIRGTRVVVIADATQDMLIQEVEYAHLVIQVVQLVRDLIPINAKVAIRVGVGTFQVDTANVMQGDMTTEGQHVELATTHVTHVQVHHQVLVQVVLQEIKEHIVQRNVPV